MRVNITLECTSCKERNYLTNKNKRNNPDRLEKMKYCPRERKVTLHKEQMCDDYVLHQILLQHLLVYHLH
jgi:large subunit ribosomal protein L33